MGNSVIEFAVLRKDLNGLRVFVQGTPATELQEIMNESSDDYVVVRFKAYDVWRFVLLGNYLVTHQVTWKQR